MHTPQLALQLGSSPVNQRVLAPAQRGVRNRDRRRLGLPVRRAPGRGDEPAAAMTMCMHPGTVPDCTNFVNFGVHFHHNVNRG